MERNKISIIIPAYNLEALLGRTLDSVLAQTYENIEIIAVNDGSTDGTGAVMDAYAAKDSRVKAIHKENGGVTSARLRGVAEATGDWIGFVDGDDIIEPEMYERLLGNALQYHADISHCGNQMVFPDGRVAYNYDTGILLIQDRSTGLNDLLTGIMIEPALGNKLFRRELFENLEQKMDTSIKINEDLLMNYYLFREAALSVYEDVCLYHYVLRKGSASTSGLNVHKLMGPIRVTKIMMADAEPALQDVLLAKLTRQLVTLAVMPAGEQPELVIPHREAARRELRSRLGEILRSGIGMKLKLMALWPTGYGWVHRIYARVTGADKKYEIA